MRLSTPLPRISHPVELLSWADQLEADGAVKTVTTTYTATALDELLLADASGGAFTVTLPRAEDGTKRLTIKRISAGLNAVTIGVQGLDTIEGSASVSLATQWAGTTLQSNGVDAWVVLAST
jgi:hypothetical protein